MVTPPPPHRPSPSSVPSTPSSVPTTSSHGLAAQATPTEAAQPPPSPTALSGIVPSDHDGFDHAVAEGETLLGLALHYGVPMAAIQLENGLEDGTGLWEGEVLRIPPAQQWEAASPYWLACVVEEGSTLSGIAQQNGLDVDTLRDVNELAVGDLLSVGQPLILPLEAPGAQPACGPLSRAEAVPTEASNPPEDTPPVPTEPAVAMDVAAPVVAPASSSAATADDVSVWTTEVLRLINAERSAYGLAPLQHNETLAQAARLHAQDCYQRGSCNHTGSDNSGVKTRVTRAGYDGIGWAECIVYSYSPEEAVRWWMDEVPPNDAHRRTLLSDWLTEIGIGVVPTGRGDYYFIADFGRPREP